MRKIYLTFIAVLIFFCSVFFASPADAFGVAVYGRAESADVGFYASETATSPLFYIPTGYYVTITGEVGDFYTCEYAQTESSYVKKYGLVKKSEIYIDSDMALPLFAEVSLTAIKDTTIYTSPTFEYAIASISAGQTAYFYGMYTDESTVCYYVKISNDFGYVATSAFEYLEIPTHPKQLSSAESYVIPQEEDSDALAEVQTESEEGDEFLFESDVMLAMILCVCLPAIVFLVYIFAPKDSASKRYFE